PRRSRARAAGGGDPDARAQRRRPAADRHPRRPGADRGGALRRDARRSGAHVVGHQLAVGAARGSSRDAGGDGGRGALGVRDRAAAAAPRGRRREARSARPRARAAGGDRGGQRAPGARLKRRAFVTAAAAVGAFPLRKVRAMGAQRHVVVVGAGAFGGWTALYLRRRGARVTLVDAWGPGNARASSGGDTRVLRATYGPRGVYTRLAVRARALWREHERRWGRRLYHEIGVLWLVEDDDRYERAALPLLREAGVAFEQLSGAETARRYPQINCERVRWAILERSRRSRGAWRAGGSRGCGSRTARRSRPTPTCSPAGRGSAGSSPTCW